MGTRTFQAVVVLLWLATMSWLMIAKVLPPLLVGEPPTYRSTMPEPDRLIGWQIDWNEQPLGWAATRSVGSEGGGAEIHSRLVLNKLPLNELLPVWLGSIVRRQVGSIDFDARSRFDIDPLGRLAGFDSRVRLSEMENAIRMIGMVDNSQLELSVQVGDFKYRKQMYLEPGALVGNELSPQAEFSGLRLGQAWTLRSYSPFRSPSSPLEVLAAKVEREEVIDWAGAAVDTLIVVYRNDSGAGGGNAATPRGTLWVRSDGKVLRQEIQVLSSVMRFVRLTDKQAEEHADQLSVDWLIPSVMVQPDAGLYGDSLNDDSLYGDSLNDAAADLEHADSLLDEAPTAPPLPSAPQP